MLATGGQQPHQAKDGGVLPQPELATSPIRSPGAQLERDTLDGV